MLLIALILGGVVGLMLGLTGAGGGIFAVPALILGLGWTMVQASPVALFTVAGAAGIGMMIGLRQGLVRYRAALLISVMGIVATPFGQYLAHILPERGLIILFVSVMLIVAARMFISSSKVEGEDFSPTKTCVINTETGRIDWNLVSFFKLCLIGLVSGMSTGLLGVGGGFIVVPAMLRCSNLPMNSVVATSLMVITLISSGAVLSALVTGSVNLSDQSVVFMLGAAGGMLLGRQFAKKMPVAHLQRTFSMLISGVALLMLGKLFF
jgi:uncharacterized membrane protein YfcA